jgi:hypothetical protein
MTDHQLAALKADYLEWTGGFVPEAEDDISAYISAAMPIDFDDRAVAEALKGWLAETNSIQVRRYLNKQ